MSIGKAAGGASRSCRSHLAPPSSQPHLYWNEVRDRAIRLSRAEVPAAPLLFAERPGFPRFNRDMRASLLACYVKAAQYLTNVGRRDAPGRAGILPAGSRILREPSDVGPASHSQKAQNDVRSVPQNAEHGGQDARPTPDPRAECAIHHAISFGEWAKAKEEGEGRNQAGRLRRKAWTIHPSHARQPKASIYRPAFAARTSSSWMDQKRPFTEPVWVMRMCRAFTGSKAMSVVPGMPLPMATGLLHACPSAETSTL